MQFLHEFALAFVPLFVALDPIGILPYYVAFSAELDEKARRKATIQAVLAAALFAIFFLFVGKGFFKVIGITQDDFKIAGGVLLLVLSVADIINPEKEWRKPSGDFGVVPIGIPLIVGPAVLTTELILVDLYGIAVTGTAVLTNIAIAGLTLGAAGWFRRTIGDGGVRAISKIASLLLAAMAVMMIRSGIQGSFHLG